MAYDFDLIVIGSGPAGEKGAAQAAYYGKRVAVIERAPWPGGAGINTGTAPSKTLRETALYFSGLRQRGLFGIDYSLKEGLTVRDFMYRETIVVERGRHLIVKNLRKHDIELIWGQGTLKDAHTVAVTLNEGGTRDVTADMLLIATGSSPLHPEGVPFGNELVFDSDGILTMKRMPRSMAIVGGGVIGSEYASIFAALGVRVTLLDSRERLLPFVDGEMVERLEAQLRALGVRFVFNTRVAAIDLLPGHVRLTLGSGEALECEIVLYAAGRQSNVKGLGLEAVGVKVGQRGLIQVNDKYQTEVPNIFAAGDVIGFPALASTSMEQARVAMVHAFGLLYKERISPILPYAVYTIPELSTVGLTEEECQKTGVPYLAGRAYYENNTRGQIIGDLTGMVKLVFSPVDKRLLGVHLIGELASELIHLGAHVLADGGTIDAFIEAVYNFPTLSDAYKYAAYDGLQNREKWTRDQAGG